jgi:hypothetical protein
MIMNDLLDSLDENVDATYFKELDSYMKTTSRPLNLEEFMKLEMKFYDRYQKEKGRRNKNDINRTSRSM